MATIGISAERTMIRGVVLADGIVSRAARRRLPGAGPGPAITEVLDGFSEELGAGAQVEDVAIVYRSVVERRLIVSQLAAGKWASSSLVSERSALAVLARDEWELDEFGTVLVLEILDDHTSFVLLGPDRDTVSASGSWAHGTVDADSASRTVGRIRPILNSIDTRPDAIAVCGSGAGDPDIATVLQVGLKAPVIPTPDTADAAAYGAALISAQRLRELPVVAPTGGHRTRRLLLGAAAVATVLGASGIAVAQIRDDHSAQVAGRDAESRPPSAPAPITIEAAPAAASSEPITIEPSTPRPIAPTPPPRIPPRTAAAPTSETTGPPEPTTSTTSESPTSTQTTVGAPDGNWLFPGESPPPPLNADPEVVRAWWDNHWMLQERWLRGG